MLLISSLYELYHGPTSIGVSLIPTSYDECWHEHLEKPMVEIWKLNTRVKFVVAVVASLLSSSVEGD